MRDRFDKRKPLDPLTGEEMPPAPAAPVTPAVTRFTKARPAEPGAPAPGPRRAAAPEPAPRWGSDNLDADIAAAREKLEHLIGKPAAPAAETEERKTARNRRFRPIGNTIDSPEKSPASIRPGSAPAPGEPAPVWEEPDPKPFVPYGSTWESNQPLNRIPPEAYLAFVVGALFIGAFGGWLLRAYAYPSEPAPISAVANREPGEPISDTFDPTSFRAPAFDILGSPSVLKFEEALAAEVRGDLDKAERLYREARGMNPRAPGIDFRLGLIALRRGNSPRAVQELKNAIRSGESAAAAASQLGSVYTEMRDVQAANAAFLTAIGLEPLRARHYLLWGDSARRTGLPLLALARYQAALKREITPGEALLIRVKLALVEIERGNASLIDQRLAAAPPEERKGAEWLVLSAATEVRRGEFDAAAAHLKAASADLPGATLSNLHNDVFFEEFLLQPVVGPAIKALGSAPAAP